MPKASRRWIIGVALSLSLGGAAIAATSSDESVNGVIAQAAEEVSFLSFDRALPLFEKALEMAPAGSDEWQAAAFGRATSLHHMTPATASRILEAAAGYRTIIEKYPRSRFAPPSMMALGRIEELIDYKDDVPHLDTARDWYQKARDAAGKQPLADEATLRIAGTFIQQMTAEPVRQGIAVLEAWLKDHPDNPLASAMWQYAADTYFYPLKDERKALDCYLKADAIGLMEHGREGPIYWRMANLAERVSDRETAVAYYTKIIMKTPTSGKAYESQLALQRLNAPVPEISILTIRPATQPAEGRTGEKP